MTRARAEAEKWMSDYNLSPDCKCNGCEGKTIAYEAGFRRAAELAAEIAQEACEQGGADETAIRRELLEEK